jgi:threonine-phosphate decarboxylase
VRYPTAHDRALRDALGEANGVDAERVVIANGASALIDVFVRTVAPQRALVPQPAFSEYARALAAAGCATIAFELDPDDDFRLDVARAIAALDRGRADAVIVTNPHNPSGACTPPEAIGALVAAAVARGVPVLVDEAFIDYVPEQTALAHAAHGNVFVLRSLTKFYAMPGLRVGYGIAPAPFARELIARVPSWPVTSLAADAARSALGDHGYARTTRRVNATERAALAAALRDAGVRVFEGAANFVLFATTAPAPRLAERLAAEHRIVVRDCRSFPGLEDGRYVRVAVRTRGENERLVAAVRSVLTYAG